MSQAEHNRVNLTVKSPTVPRSKSQQKLETIRGSALPPSNGLEVPDSISKKQLFTEYVKKSGFKAAMVRVIVALYEDEEKPDDPHEWIYAFLGYGIPTKPLIEMIQKEANNLRSKVAALQEENSRLSALVDEKDGEVKGPEPLIDWDDLLKVSDDEGNGDDIFLRASS